MGWQFVTAEVIIAIILVQVITLVLMLLWRRIQVRVILPKLIKLRNRALRLQNENWHNDLGGNDLDKLEWEIVILRELMFAEVSKISQGINDQLNSLYKFDIAPFKDVVNDHQRMLLGYIRQTWQIANSLIDKYS